MPFASKIIVSLVSLIILASGANSYASNRCGDLFKSGSSPLKNTLIDPQTGHSSWGPVKVWGLDNILSVLHQRTYTKRGRIGEFGELIGFVVNQKVTISETFANGDKSYVYSELQAALYKREEAAKLILEQYPELAKIEEPVFTNDHTDSDVQAWVSKQTAKYGDSLPLVQVGKTGSS